MGSPRSISWTPPQAYSVQLRICYLWSGQGTHQNTQSLVGKSSHHIHITQDFVEQANKVTLLPGKCLSSYDVTALFTSVPIDPALGIIKDLLEKDNTLKERTVLPDKKIILLLEFCLKTPTFPSKVNFMNS